MRLRHVALPLLVALTLLPTTAAASGDDAPVAGAADAVATTTPGYDLAANCAPPCGWINPLIALDFDDKQRCRNAPDDCMLPPAYDEPMQFDGEFRWYWEVTEEGTYVDDAQKDIEVSFGGTSSNPSWIDFDIEPAGFAISTADLFDPNRFVVVGDAPDSKLWYEYRVPVTITFTRTGEPNPDEVERILGRDGVQPLFMKAKSTESSDRFKAAFGVEEFRFYSMDEATGGAHVNGNADGESAPGAPIVVAISVLAGAAFVASRRRL